MVGLILDTNVAFLVESRAAACALRIAIGRACGARSTIAVVAGAHIQSTAVLLRVVTG